ncbi:MAG: heme-binding protein [Bacteroidetes bacterium]|nr:heme-binding protein [Bacteroidota bacterium]
MKRKLLIWSAAILLLIISLPSIYSIMAKTPQQPYKELGKKDEVEFRYYPESVMASVTSNNPTYKGSANKNFRVLAGYIFGGNQSSNKIAMTAPVHMQMENGQSTMSFVMPEGSNLDNLPKPSSGAIELHNSPEEYVAVLRFGGWASDEKIERKKRELNEQLSQLGIQHQNNFRYLGYNAPWDILFRRNEIVVGISKEAVPAL